ncbi:MAG: hypothetical protein H0W44_05290 [Gammaproteobacteria bacterium]|nr:hypothetical protein [Gammaproteobacteria bacterium]
MLALNAEHKTYLIKELILGIFINGGISASLAWLNFHNHPMIYLWNGSQGITQDLLPTIFMITFMSTMAVTLTTRGRLAKSQVTPRALLASEAWLAKFPRNVVLRSISFALCFEVLLWPVTIGLLYLFNIHALSFIDFFIFKIVFGVVLGLLATVPIVLCALADKYHSQT